MADIKTHLRELSVATILGLLKTISVSIERFIQLQYVLAIGITGYRFRYQ